MTIDADFKVIINALLKEKNPTTSSTGINNSLELIKQFKYPNYQTTTGWTLLSFAANNGCIEAVETLLHFREETNLELNTKNEKQGNYTALMFATEKGNSRIVEHL